MLLIGPSRKLQTTSPIIEKVYVVDLWGIGDAIIMASIHLILCSDLKCLQYVPEKSCESKLFSRHSGTAMFQLHRMVLK